MQLSRQGGRAWGLTRIDARADGGTTRGSVLTVHMSLHDPGPDPQRDETLLTRFLTAVDGGVGTDSAVTFLRGARTSAAVAAWVGDEEAPELVVDRLMSGAVAASTAGAVVDNRTCRVGLRPGAFQHPDSRDGFLLTMRSETPAPVELFPSLLYCWMVWWRKQVSELYIRPETSPPPQGRTRDDHVGQLADWIQQVAENHRRQPVVSLRAPLPPEQLDMIEDGRRYTVRLDDTERTTWPDLPPGNHRNCDGPD